MFEQKSCHNFNVGDLFSLSCCVCAVFQLFVRHKGVYGVPSVVKMAKSSCVCTLLKHIVYVKLLTMVLIVELLLSRRGKLYVSFA